LSLTSRIRNHEVSALGFRIDIRFQNIAFNSHGRTKAVLNELRRTGKIDLQHRERQTKNRNMTSGSGFDRRKRLHPELNLAIQDVVFAGESSSHEPCLLFECAMRSLQR